jgi:formate hydrogenlyase transcriptional activator
MTYFGPDPNKRRDTMSHGKDESLFPEDHKLLAAAALFQGDFLIDWLVELTNERVFQTLSTLEKAVERGWLSRSSIGVYQVQNLPDEYYSHFDDNEKLYLHNRIVNILMRNSQQDETNFLTMAHHLLHTSNDLDKCKMLVKAGDLHLQFYRNEEALQCYKKVTEDLSQLSGEEVNKFFIRVAIKYSKISTARHHNKKVRLLLQEAIARAKKCGAPYYQSILEMHQAKNEWLGSRFKSAFQHFERGWNMAKELDDPRLLRSAAVFSTFFLYWQGRFGEAVSNYEKSAPDVDRLPKEQFPLLAAITVGQCYAFTGEASQALGMLDAIFSHCMDKGDISLAANAEGTIGSIMLQIHRMNDAFRYLEGSLEKARQKHNYFLQILVKYSLAYAYYLIGDLKKSIAYLEDFLDQSEQVKVTVQLYPYLMEICWAMEEGRFPKVRGLSIEKEVDRMIKGKNVFLKGVAYRYRALIERANSLSAEQVLHSLFLSLRFLDDSGHRIESGITRLEMARQYMWMKMDQKAEPFIDSAARVLSNLSEEVIPYGLRHIIKRSEQEGDLLKEILHLGQEIVTIRNNRDLVHHIIVAANSLTGAERGAIFLLEETGGTVLPYLRGSKNLTIDDMNQTSFSPSMKVIREVAKSGKGQIVGGSASLESENLSDEPIRSCICVPMFLRDKVVGVLYNDNRLLGSSFKESDLDLLSYFAALAAFALDNTKAYEEIQRLNQKLQEEKQYYEEKHLQSLNFEEIIGESPAISLVLSKVAQVAQTDATVLIYGETGVGKELVASAIHRHSKRVEKPFIRVHCNALPESLIPSELFGHEKGAFTGAERRRIGRFELADGGTLFLDEIGDLPLDVQVRLLRVLQSKEFERVGGTETLRSDFRLVVATNRDLEELVNGKRIREDFYYRINVFPIYVPPLRERKEDIPLLAHYFLQIHSKKIGKNFSGIPKKEIVNLMEYDWPGNIRELENVIERGTVLSAEPIFQVPPLGMSHTEQFYPKGNSTTLKENERSHILWALQKTRWKVRGSGGAAELLDIHPSTLAFRMKKLDIHRPEGFFRRGRPAAPLNQSTDRKQNPLAA